MAEHGGYDIKNRAAMDYAEHRRTYNGFLGVVKYGAATIVVILILMAYFLV